MPNVLTTDSDVNCGHKSPTPPFDPGKVQTDSAAKLKVNGNPVLLESSIDGKSISACGIIPANDPSGTPTDMKCIKVSAIPQTVPIPPVPPPPAITNGQSTKLMVGGKPVMLDTLKGLTNGMQNKLSPLSDMSATANQRKLTAV